MVRLRDSPGRILVIEDEPLVRAMLRSVLERAGYQVSEAEDGEEGLALLRSEPADLVITDLLMPEKGGIETCREIVRGFGETKALVISGVPIAPAHARILRRHGVASLRKPFARHELLEAVRRLLGTPAPGPGKARGNR